MRSSARPPSRRTTSPLVWATRTKARRKSSLLVVLAAGSMAFSACSDESPSAPELDPTAAFSRSDAPGQARRAAGIDAEFAQIARDAPGFGGMFYDNGRLHVYATLNADRGAVLNRVNASLRARGRAVPAAGDVTVIPAGRDYAELATLRERMSPVLGESGVVFTDVDETRNQLRVGVLEGVSTARIEAALRRLDVPLDAVHIETTPPIVPLATLRELQNPVAGGLQIWRFEPPSTAWICTLGFNVMVGGAPHFFTNSHCTEERSVVEGSEIRQDRLVLPSRIIGVEVADPPYFRCQYAGYRCRWSDAALIQYVPGIDAQLGMIYRTTSFGTTGPGSIDIDPTGNGFLIIDDASFPVVGEVLDKVGRTTGWTRGPVVGTCIDTGVTGVNPRVVVLCQDFVQAAVGGGDSGSPVFAQNGMNRPVTLYGILWGGGGSTFVFSALENIRAEFAAFRTH